MSFELQTLMFGVILIVGLICVLGTLNGLFRKNISGIRIYSVGLLLCVVSFYVAIWGFNYQRIQGLVGSHIDFGEAIVEFGCCYDHHGDAIEVIIYAGDSIEYRKILTSNIGSYPSELLNINNHKYLQKWIPVSQLNETGKEALRVSGQSVQYAKEQGFEVEILFQGILNHSETYVSYIYNGNSRVYLWLLNVELAQFVDITKY